MKQATERRLAVHDQVTLVHEKTDLVVGQLAGHRFYLRFIRIGAAVHLVDAAEMHD